MSKNYFKKSINAIIGLSTNKILLILHIFTYLFVNSLFLLVWLLTKVSYFLSFQITLGWGFLIGFHTITYFIRDDIYITFLKDTFSIVKYQFLLRILLVYHFYFFIITNILLMLINTLITIWILIYWGIFITIHLIVFLLKEKNFLKKKLKRFGTLYSGFYYPEKLNGLDSNSIIYCAGVGEDISHDIMIAKATKANVYLFDPTPRAINHVEDVKNTFKKGEFPQYNPRHGGGDKNYWNIILDNQISEEKIKMYPFGLYSRDDTLKFYSPINKEFVSHSLVKGMKSNEFIKVKVKSITSIMKMLNHNRIDLLKIDIEGVECQVIEYMLENHIYPKYLSVDFDLARFNRNGKISCNKCIKKLLKIGYKILNFNEYNYSFVYKSVFF